MLFQILHLEFTAARSDTLAFRRYRERTTASALHRSANPDQVFEDTASAVEGQHHARALHAGTKFNSALALDQAIAFWKERTKNASGFTFVLTGDYSLSYVRPLIATYLASLPGGVHEQPRDNGVRFPDGVVIKNIHSGIASRARARLVFSAPFEFTSRSSTDLTAVRDVAEFVLGERLRQIRGGTYDVDVSTGVDFTPPLRYRIAIELEAAPARVDSLVNTALLELRRLGTAGPTAVEVKTIRDAEARDLKVSLERNGYWARALSLNARMGWPLAEISGESQRVASITAETLRAACAHFLTTDHYTRVVMYPEEGRVN